MLLLETIPADSAREGGIRKVHWRWNLRWGVARGQVGEEVMRMFTEIARGHSTRMDVAVGRKEKGAGGEGRHDIQVFNKERRRTKGRRRYWSNGYARTVVMDDRRGKHRVWRFGRKGSKGMEKGAGHEVLSAGKT